MVEEVFNIGDTVTYRDYGVYDEAGDEEVQVFTVKSTFRISDVAAVYADTLAVGEKGGNLLNYLLKNGYMAPATDAHELHGYTLRDALRKARRQVRERAKLEAAAIPPKQRRAITIGDV